jgi:hypothetical protein
MHVPKSSEERSFNTFTYAAVKLPKDDVTKALTMVSNFQVLFYKVRLIFL